MRPPSSSISEIRCAPEDPLVGVSLGGRLSVEERIAEGALGVVYRARHLHLGKAVAVKLLHDQLEANTMFRERFHTEAKLASSLDHPNLVRILDFGEEVDHRLWLAMEWLEGVELEEELVRNGHLPLERAVHVALEVAAGLAHAHAGGVVHGDVKPANVLLVKRFNDDGEECEGVKLCDFGVARGVGGALLGGTPQYMSPEQCVGRPLDARSDVYALGVMLYELVTGVLPFDGEDAHAILQQHLVVRPAPPSQRRRGVDARLDRVILRALEKNAADRHPSMREFRADLKILLSELDGKARPASTPPPPLVAPSKEIIDARTFVAAREKRALSDVLESGDPAEIAAHVARLAARDSDALGLLDDPHALAPLAESLLARDVDSSPYLDDLLARAGLAAARALWSARVRGEATPARRQRFVGWLSSLGHAARPVLLVGLKRVATTSHEHACLVEDLLLVLPRFPDPELARAVEPLLTSESPRVREVALSRSIKLRLA